MLACILRRCLIHHQRDTLLQGQAGDLLAESRAVTQRRHDAIAAIQHRHDYIGQLRRLWTARSYQGAGSRFVHGGASLQEIVIPVIEISKKRKSDIEFVDVDIISGSSNITSNSFGVSFYQKQPVADKILQRQLKAGIYSANNKLISEFLPSASAFDIMGATTPKAKILTMAIVKIRLFDKPEAATDAALLPSILPTCIVSATPIATIPN